MPDSIAKLCAVSKQHIAQPPQDIHAMADDSIVYVVARALEWHMRRMKLNETALGKRAKVSPRTVGNFLRPGKREVSASGKVPSGKLTELEMIARALGVSFVDLVQDMTDEAREERGRVQMAVALLSGKPPTTPPSLIEYRRASTADASMPPLADEPTAELDPAPGKASANIQPQQPTRRP